LPGNATPEDDWALLHRNAGTGAGVKFALDETGRSCRLRGELALDLDEPAELEAHVEALVARVKDASANLRRKKAQAKDRNGATAVVAPAPVARYVEEAGWPFVERSEGRVAVPLEVSRRVIHAVVEPTPEGGVVVSAALTNGEVPPAGANREALAVLLLTVTRDRAGAPGPGVCARSTRGRGGDAARDRAAAGLQRSAPASRPVGALRRVRVVRARSRGSPRRRRRR
ncbi:MAG: hypothetical protein ACYTF4_18055, partial [Planctomycetota bacterium]